MNLRINNGVILNSTLFLFVLCAIEQFITLFNQLGSEQVAEILDREYSNKGFEKGLEATADILAESSEFISTQVLMSLYAYAGNTDKFLYWLEKTYIRKNPDLPYIGVIPVFKRFENELRYIEIMQRMNLPLGKFE